MRTILPLLVAAFATNLQGLDHSLESLVGKNYIWDTYFENTEVEIIESNIRCQPCNPTVQNSGSLHYSNQVAEFKVPIYRAIEIIKNDSRNETIVEYLMERLEADLKVSELPKDYQEKVSEAIHDLISENCFTATLFASNEPLEFYQIISHSRRISEGVSFVTTDGVIFHQKVFMHVTRDMLTPRTNAHSYPRIEFKKPEVSVPIKPIRDELTEKQAYQ